MDPITLPQHIDRDELEALARSLHAKNYNCAQSVSCALAPRMGIDEDVCFRLAEGLGGGLGTHTETCGALLGGAMVLGLARSNGCADPTSKGETYKLVTKLVNRFRTLYGTNCCQEIRAQDATGVNPMEVCKDAVAEAAKMTADILEDLASQRAQI